MKRIFLFVATNLAVLALLSVVLFIVERVFGVRLAQGGMGGVVVFAAIFGFGGSLISLAMSNRTAKRRMGVRVIAAPQSDMERWLLAILDRDRLRIPDRDGLRIPSAPANVSCTHLSGTL